MKMAVEWGAGHVLTWSSICGEAAEIPSRLSSALVGLDYVSCSPFRSP